jgi:hypothetical protein
MSFVFREPALPRYLISIYPLFLVAIALSFDMLLLLLQKIKIKPIYAVPVLVVMISFLPTAKASVQMVRSKKHGNVTDAHFSSFYFPDWKSSLMQIKPLLQKNDVLMSTIPSYVDFYLNRKSYQFRQRMYDVEGHNYINLPVDTIDPNANSTEAVARLLDNTDRAWLIADYYFDKAVTDSGTKGYVVNRMKFEYDMSNEYVSVFFYDKTQPPPHPSEMFEFIHSENKVSIDYQFQKPSGNNIVMLLDIEGLQYDNEAMVLFNDQIWLGVLREQGLWYKETGDSRSRQVYIVPVPLNALKEGINQAKIGLNSHAMYKKCRYAVYDFRIGGRNE